jgi:hypothetical protein
MKRFIVLMLIILTLCLSGCSTTSGGYPYKEIDMQRFIKVTIIEIKPKIFYVDNDSKHTIPYQIAKIKVDFHYNDLIVAFYDEFPYEDDIIDAMIT